MNAVCVVLLNYNGSNDTIECLKSLEKSSYKNLIICVVDNASKENDFMKIRKYMEDNYEINLHQEKDKKIFDSSKKYNLFRSNENLGFAKGNNFGIKLIDKIYEVNYYLLLNNDTIIKEDFIENLSKPFIDKKVACSTGLILSFDNKDIIWYAGGDINKLKCKGRHFHYGLNINDIELCEKDVSFCSGCCTMFDRQALFEIGLLNERYFFGCEEYDYSLKIKSKGYKMIFTPTAVLYHKVKIHLGNGSSHDIQTPKYVYNSLRNKQVFALDNYNRLEYLIWQGCFYFYTKYVFKKRFKKILKFKNSDELLNFMLIKFKQNKNCEVDLKELEDFEREFDELSK